MESIAYREELYRRMALRSLKKKRQPVTGRVTNFSPAMQFGFMETCAILGIPWTDDYLNPVEEVIVNIPSDTQHSN